MTRAFHTILWIRIISKNFIFTVPGSPHLCLSLSSATWISSAFNIRLTNATIQITITIIRKLQELHALPRCVRHRRLFLTMLRGSFLVDLQSLVGRISICLSNLRTSIRHGRERSREIRIRVSGVLLLSSFV